MATLKDVLAAGTAELAQLAVLKIAVQAVPPAIQTLKDQLAAGSPVTAADLDGIVASMNSATSEIGADAATLTTATTVGPVSTGPLTGGAA